MDRRRVRRPCRRVDGHSTEELRLRRIRQVQDVDIARDIGQRRNRVGVPNADDLAPVRAEARIVSGHQRQLGRPDE